MKHGVAFTATCWACSVAFCAEGDLPRPTGIYAERVITAGDIVASADSPFGFHPGGVYRTGYADNGFVDAQYIGVHWHRPPVYAYWFLIQPNLASPTYNWTFHDAQHGAVPPGINILANIAPQGPIDEGYSLPGSYLPVDSAKYQAFVRATVERYDGDGVDDMPGLSVPIRYWQVGNEPGFGPDAGRREFAQLQALTHTAIKDACSYCPVLIGGATGFPQDFVNIFLADYAPILTQLNGQYVDIFDFHWYGNATGDYRLLGQALAVMQDKLQETGFGGIPIWVTEMGSYSGDPIEPWFRPQTERQQAADCFKRFVYPISVGIKKVFPAFGLMEEFIQDDGYFDHTGLIYDGTGSGDLGLGVKKLGYYTYKKMTEKLEGADWTTITLLRDGVETDHLYLVRVTKDGQPLHIAWWDYFDEPGYTPGDTKNITVSGLSGLTATATTVVPRAALGRDVADYQTAFDIVDYPITGGSVTIPLGEDPVIILLNSSASVPAVSQWGLVTLTILLTTAAAVVIRRTRRAQVPREISSMKHGIAFTTACCACSVAFCTGTAFAQVLQYVRTVPITTTGEGGSARPEVAATADRVFVLYLGNIQSGGSRTFSLKVYDNDLQNLLTSQVLVSTTTQYGGPTDIRVAGDGQYLYAFYETNKPTSPTTGVTYLWGAEYRLDDAFDRVAYTAAPIAESRPMSELSDGGELLDDPAPLVGPSSVFVVTRLKYSLSMSGRTVYRVREFSKTDLSLQSQFDLDLSSAADGRGRVASLLYWNNRIYMALATTVSDQGINENVDDGAKSDVILVRMQPDWTFNPQTDVRTISAEPNDVENYVCGLKGDSDYLYITYKQSAGAPPNGEHRAWVKVFDIGLNLVQAEQVRSTIWGPGGGELRPSLEVLGDRTYSGQSAGTSLGSGDGLVFVYQVSRSAAIPSVSQWGVIVMVVALLAVGTVVVRANVHRRTAGESTR